MSGFVKAVTAKGTRYFYFTPPAHFAAAGLRPRALGKDELSARRRAARLIREWQNGQPQRIARLENRRRRQLADFVRELFTATRKRARQRGIPFTLTKDTLDEMLVAQQWNCAVTGLPFELKSAAGLKAFRDPFRPSVDRADGTRGYIDGNCRLVLTAVNYAIGEWGEATFFRIAEAAVKAREERTRAGFRKTASGKRKTNTG